MHSLFGSPIMTALTIGIVIVHAVSLILMSALMYEYRHIHEKRLDILESLGAEGLVHRTWERRLLMGVYAGSTILIAVVSLVIFITQPHLF